MRSIRGHHRKEHVRQESDGYSADDIPDRSRWQGRTHFRKGEARGSRRGGARGFEGTLQEVNVAKLPPLRRDFYDRDPRRVSRDLLGKLLIRREDKRHLIARIVEVEAYLEGDPAAHSFAGRTARNAVLFGPPGHAYVYFIYGNHWCFNVSCLPDGIAGGVLFRAAEPIEGIEAMAQARGISLQLARNSRLLASGPGRLSEAFGITRLRDNNKDLTMPGSDLWLADDGCPRPKIATTVRIGLTKAAERPLRYVIRGNPFVSGKKVTP